MAYRRDLNYFDESNSSTSTKYSGRSFDVSAVIDTPFSPSDPYEEPTYLLHPIQVRDDKLIQQWDSFLEETVMAEVRELWIQHPTENGGSQIPPREVPNVP